MIFDEQKTIFVF